jgi:hypothetical protein
MGRGDVVYAGNRGVGNPRSRRDTDSARGPWVREAIARLGERLAIRLASVPGVGPGPRGGDALTVRVVVTSLSTAARYHLRTAREAAGVLEIIGSRGSLDPSHSLPLFRKGERGPLSITGGSLPRTVWSAPKQFRRRGQSPIPRPA